MKRDRRPRKLRPIAEVTATAGSSVAPDSSGWLANLDDAALAGRLATLNKQADEAREAGLPEKAIGIDLKAAPFRRETTRRLARVDA